METNEKSFEESLARLEEIVRLLESGQAPLDKSLELYEEGVALVKNCNGKLDNVEKRIKILTSDGNGNVVEKDFTGENQ